MIVFETVNRFDTRWLAHFFEPSRGAPWVVAGDLDEAVIDGVVMSVVQASEITLFIGEECLAKVVPD